MNKASKQPSIESLYEAVKQIAPVAIIKFQNEQPRIQKINKIACRIIGYTEQELIKINPSDLFFNQQEAELQKARIKSILSGEKIQKTVEYKLKAKDGHEVFTALTIKPYYQKNKLTNLLAVFYDLTELKSTQETLKASIQMTQRAQQELHLILDSSPIIVFYKDKEGKIKQVNQAFAKALNTTKEKIIGKTVADLYTKEIAQAMRNDDLIVMKSKKPKLHIIEPYNAPSGLRWIRTDKIPSYDENGNVNGIIGFSEDITDRKKAQDDLAESENKYRMLIETAAEGIVLAKPNGKYTFINNRFAQMLGYNPEEIIGKTGEDFANDEKEAQQITNSRKLLYSGQCVFGERVFKRKNATPLWTAFNASPLYDKDGKHIADMALYTDITERKKMETQLKEQERLAAIGATAAMVGHDIRNPLQAIMGDTYLLRNELKNLPPNHIKTSIAENIEGIEKNISYINKIVVDLQDYARPLKPDYTTIDINQTIQNTIQTIDIPKNIKITTKTTTTTATPTNNTPKTKSEAKPTQTQNREDAPAKIQTDLTFLRRILTNLINNALQAMPNGGELTLTTHTTSTHTYITVADTGVGIPKDIQNKIFTPMITTKAKGQGLGLAVVKRLTDALNANITYQTQNQKGTQFTIQLPNTKPTT